MFEKKRKKFKEKYTANNNEKNIRNNNRKKFLEFDSLLDYIDW